MANATCTSPSIGRSSLLPVGHNLPHAVEGLMTHVMYEGVTTPYLLGPESGNEPE